MDLRKDIANYIAVRSKNKIFRVFLIRIVVLVLSFQSVVGSEKSLTMVGGLPVDIKERPYQVSINVNYIPLLYADCHGAGVIISSKYVLTAAHICDQGLDYVVRAGSSDCTWWGTVYHIKSIKPHPLFTRNPTLINDVAILEMATSIIFTDVVQPIIMADENFSPSNLFVEISGYGRICHKEDCPNSKQLMKIELETTSVDECQKSLKNWLPNMICHIDKNKQSTSKNLIFIMPTLEITNFSKSFSLQG